MLPLEMVSKQQNSHVVLDEFLDFVACEFIFAEFDRAVFKLVAELGWTEQNYPTVNQKRKMSLRADAKR